MEENNDNITKISAQSDVDKAKNAENDEIKEIKDGKDNKEDEGKELIFKYSPTNSTLAELLTKPLTKASIHKIHNSQNDSEHPWSAGASWKNHIWAYTLATEILVKSQECVGEKNI
jgi:hypothetical protein